MMVGVHSKSREGFNHAIYQYDLMVYVNGIFKADGAKLSF